MTVGCQGSKAAAKTESRCAADKKKAQTRDDNNQQGDAKVLKLLGLGKRRVQRREE